MMYCKDCDWGKQLAGGIGCKNPNVPNMFNPQIFMTRRVESKNTILYKDGNEKFVSIEDTDKNHVHACFPNSFGCVHFKEKLKECE